MFFGWIKLFFLTDFVLPITRFDNAIFFSLFISLFYVFISLNENFLTE